MQQEEKSSWGDRQVPFAEEGPLSRNNYPFPSAEDRPQSVKRWTNRSDLSTFCYSVEETAGVSRTLSAS